MFTTAESPDGQIANRIATGLAETNRASLKKLSVDVAGGLIRLSGRVASFHEKQLALTACRLFPGSYRLIDAVTVAGS